MVTYTYRTVSDALPSLIAALDKGDETNSRNGRVKELLNVQVKLTNPVRREILCSGRKANVFAQIAETCWVLAGKNDVEWLSAYLPRARDYSDDGITWRAGYGPRIRDFNGVDQLARVVDMLKKDPLTRQAVIQIWDVADGNMESLKDRACNTQLQFQNRLGKLHLTVTVRSNDLFWGWSGINAFEWSTLLEIVASLTNVQVGTLTFNIANLHLYEIHWVKARQVSHSSPFVTADVPFNMSGEITTVSDLDKMLDEWFVWENDCRNGTVSPEKLSYWNDPLFRSWAAAIAYYWTRDEAWLADLKGTALAVAIALTPASVLPEPVQKHLEAVPPLTPATAIDEHVRAFYEFVTDMHAVKHSSYGNSWKKRGEKLSILANIARKVDRIGVNDKFDSAADTWIDLLVYLVKYNHWLNRRDDGPNNVNKTLRELHYIKVTNDFIQYQLQNVPHDFDCYADSVDDLPLEDKCDSVWAMIRSVAPVAYTFWLRENPDVDHYRGADID